MPDNSKIGSSSITQTSQTAQTRRIMGNTMWLTASSLGAKALAYIQFIFVARTFSPAEVGIYAVCLTGVLFAELLANLGLDRVIIREVARLETSSSRQLFDTSLLLKTSASVCTYFLCLGIFWWFYPEISHPYSAALPAFFAYVPLCALARSFESYFTAQEHMAIPALGQFAERFIMLITALAAWLGWCGFNTFLAAFPLGGLVRLSIPAILFLSHYKGKTPFTLSGGQTKKLISDSSWLFGVEILAVAYFRIDIFMLSKMANLYETGLYQAAYKIFDFGIAMFAGYLTAIFPAIARDSSRVRPGTLFKGAFIVFICLSLPLILLRQELLSFFKPEYVQAAPVLTCLMLTLPFIYINSLLANFAVATSKIRRLFFVAMPLLAINIGLNAELIPKYGILGSALATLGSELLLSGILVALLKPFACTTSTPALCNKTI